jgi:hypothetical protein
MMALTDTRAIIEQFILQNNAHKIPFIIEKTAVFRRNFGLKKATGAFIAFR